jgi:hypothetical protein
MEICWDRLKMLLKKRSIGGWVLWALAIGWKRLSDWQNVEWLASHLLPKGWPKAVPHPVTIALIVGGFIWFTVVLLWPKRVEKPLLPGAQDARMAGFSGALAVALERLVPGKDRDPRIIIEFDGGDSMKASGITGKRMFLRNNGGTDAFSVQAHDIQLDVGTATFKVIPRIAATNERQEVRISISGDTPDLVSLFLKQADRRSPHDWNEQDEPLRIRYCDHARTEFGTNVVLSCNIVSQQITVKNYLFGKVVRDQFRNA